LNRAAHFGSVRIALVTDTYDPQVNGVTTVLRRMADAVAAAGHEVAVVAPRYPGSAWASGNGQWRVRSLAFPPYPDIRLALPPFAEARRYLDRFRPDVVHVATEGSLGLFGRRYALARGIPLITSFHTDFPRYCRDYGVARLEPLVWRWLLWFHGAARLTHTPGEAVRARLVEKGIRHAVLWGRGVDTKLFHPSRRDAAWRSRQGIAEGATLVVHVGRLAREKNLDVLIDAWAIARERLGERAVFLLVGEGPLAKEVEARVPWVGRLGFIGRRALATVYASSDVCVLPSDTETCGLVALEAMASGVAVIAADAGGFRESVRTGVNGLLAPAGDAAAFAAAIERLVSEPEARRRIGLAARRSAEERDVEIENAALIRQYEEVVR
jgi:glycosyltransferase involved in cell wall biosynthesis